MEFFRRLPARIRFAIAIVSINAAIFWAFRAVFWFSFRSTAGDLSLATVMKAWHLGVKFDLKLALLSCLPFLLLSWIPGINPIRSRVARRLWMGFFVAVQSLFFLIYFLDFGNYDYLSHRVDIGMLDHLTPVGIALQMAWETYPVVWGGLLFSVICAGYGFLIQRAAFRQLDVTDVSVARWPRIISVVVFALLYAFGIYGKWSWYPLRWSEAYFTQNEFVSALALNPVLFVLDTLPNQTKNYDEEFVRKHYDLVAGLLEVADPDVESLKFSREVVPSSIPPVKPNLVVIHLEGFGANKSSIFGNELPSTPEFDDIARQSILFTNFFVPTHGTARSAFSMVSGIPDVNPVRTASRNPRLVGQHTPLCSLEGYETFYFLGGSANWGNIRGLLAHNIPGLQIYEEGDYDGAPRGDVWGVSDMVLFEKADKVLSQQTRPFFAFIQTAGNHRPYTIPEDRRGFEVDDRHDPETLIRNGFRSSEEYNAIRLESYSLGYFFRLARNRPYLQNTVFVMYGDHGSKSAEYFPWEKIDLHRHHVPLVIYAPGLIEGGQRVATVASLVDVVPTSLSLMGIPYLATTVGRDLLVPRTEDRHFAYIKDGFLTDEFLLRVGPDGESHLYRYLEASPTVDRRDEFPEETARLRIMYDAIYETSKYLLYNNPPGSRASPTP